MGKWYHKKSSEKEFFMKRIVSIWKRQDMMNQILLVAGFILCIVSIFMKQASLG